MGTATAREPRRLDFRSSLADRSIPVLNFFCGVRGKEERQHAQQGRSYWKSCQRQGREGMEEYEFAPRNSREVGSVLTLSLFPGDLICSEAPGTPVTGTSRNEITA